MRKNYPTLTSKEQAELCSLSAKRRLANDTYSSPISDRELDLLAKRTSLDYDGGL